MEKSRPIEFRGYEAIVFEIVPDEFPLGWRFYGIRHSDDDWDRPITIEPVVVCNRWGLIGFKKPLDESMFDGDGCVVLTDEERELLLDRC